jgi:hypothetical protein
MADKIVSRRTSLYGDHLRILNLSDSDSPLTENQKVESQRLDHLDLPRLTLPPRKKNLPQWLDGIMAPRGMMATVAVVCTLLVLVVRLQTPEDRLTPKGSVRVSVYWDRGGKVSPFTAESQLQDGDRIGASVTAAEESVAYWVVSDANFKIISDPSDIHSSRLNLAPGVPQNFAASFTLVAPNQGEHLIVIVCPKGDNKTSESGDRVGTVFDQAFVSKLIAKGQLEASNCMYAGYKLRGIPK